MFRKTLDLTAILFALLLLGCSSGSVPPLVEQSQTDDEQNPEQTFPLLRWKSVETDGNESLSMGSPVSVSDRGFQVVEDIFHQLQWNDPRSEPSIIVERAAGQSLTIELSAKSTDEHSEWIAVRAEPGPQYGNTTTYTAKRSRPLKDSQHALALLRSYIQNDGKIESLVEWESQSESSGTESD